MPNNLSVQVALFSGFQSSGGIFFTVDVHSSGRTNGFFDANQFFDAFVLLTRTGAGMIVLVSLSNNKERK
tara:strand:+ start:477 stop:686 length:210 start_codon:yes stop_codon:yes gene_type:complete